MNDLFGQLTGQLGPSVIKQISQSVGTDEKKTKSMVDMALPFIMKSLEKNTATKSGAKSLEKALEKKHDGSVLDSLSTLISDPSGGEGAGILKHLLGNNAVSAEKVIAKKSGAKVEQSGQILQILAPIVMGAIGKEKKLAGLDISQIVGMIGEANKTMEDPNSSMMMTLATQFLDKDNDGDIKDDLLSMGMKALSGFFKK